MKRMAFTRSRLACAVAAGTLLAVVPPAAFAFDFQLNDGEVSGRLDTTLSAGAMWRTEGQDRELAANEDPVLMAQRGYSTQLNKNDANNNFDPGLASLVYKITPEFSLNWNEKWGALVRATAWRDSVIMGGGHDGGELIVAPPSVDNGFLRFANYSDHANNGIGDDFTSATERYAGQRARFLDAYVWTNQELFDRPLNLRLGQQVINWGEALFLQNGVNSANYIDLTALRLPGAEIKEALLPLDSLYFSYGLTYNLTWEGFYQFEWKNSEDAAAGTYFSTHDAFPGEGANHVIVDGRLVAANAGVPGLEQQFADYTLATYGPGYQYEATQVTVDRIDDEEASDSGQLGMAFRYFAEQLNGTEFALYYTRTHARLPVVGSQLTQINGIADLPENIDTTQYFMAYPEDVDMFGLSFNTTVGTVSLAGELAYRPNQPIINEVGDNLIAALAGAAAQSNPTVGDLTGHCARLSLDSDDCLPGSTPLTAGTPLYFFDFVETVNASLVSIFNFGPTLKTDGLVALLEVGFDHVSGTNDHGENGESLCYNSTAALLQSEAEIHNPDDTTYYCMDRNAWGYRAVLQADYNNIFAGISMKPSIRLAHDVSGNSHVGGNFLQDRKAATFGLDFVYLDALEVGLQATSFWGGGYSNKLKDRNNASLAVKYSF